MRGGFLAFRRVVSLVFSLIGTYRPKTARIFFSIRPACRFFPAARLTAPGRRMPAAHRRRLDQRGFIRHNRLGRREAYNSQFSGFLPAGRRIPVLPWPRQIFYQSPRKTGASNVHLRIPRTLGSVEPGPEPSNARLKTPAPHFHSFCKFERNYGAAA